MIQKIDEMSYSEFVGFINEQNRPSGGIKTIHSVALNALVDHSKKVLEVGCNTGFTAVNLSLLTGCEVIGVDVNELSLAAAKEYALKQGKDDKVHFMKADTLALPFADNSFDLVWCSNVTSFISDKKKAIMEYLRVLKTGGTLVAIPIFYIEAPPLELLQKVSEAIDSQIVVTNKKTWRELFESAAMDNHNELELYYETDYCYLDISSQIDFYVDMLMKKGSVTKYAKSEQEQLKRRALYFYSLFNRNLKYAGYSILLYQKRKMRDEIELFLTKKI
jgi:ubiquinone/menaquinone biosynthesis C-methylase UbiE